MASASPPADSAYYPSLLQELGVVPSEFLDEMMKVVDFVPREQPEMKYRGNPLKRDKFFLVRSEVSAEGEPLTLYKYSYPGFQYASLLHYHAFSTSPVFEELVGRLEKRLNCTFNHAIGTRYSKPFDEIGYHADKMLDITPGTPIVSISFLDVREFHLRPLKSKGSATYIQVLLDGDVFVLGPETNATMEHSVPSVSQEKVVKRKDGYFGDRISIVLRNIKTSLTRAQVLKKISQSTSVAARAVSSSPPLLCGVPTKKGPPCRNKQGSCPYHR